jgi:preprotein translocase subunit YajC
MGGYLILLVAVFALIWLLIVRPQRRRQLEHAQLVEQLEVGDEVLTAAGIYGHVQAIEGDEVTVEIAPATSVRFDKRAIAAIVEEEIEEGEDEELADTAGTDVNPSKSDQS